MTNRISISYSTSIRSLINNRDPNHECAINSIKHSISLANSLFLALKLLNSMPISPFTPSPSSSCVSDWAPFQQDEFMLHLFLDTNFKSFAFSTHSRSKSFSSSLTSCDSRWFSFETCCPLSLRVSIQNCLDSMHCLISAISAVSSEQPFSALMSDISSSRVMICASRCLFYFWSSLIQNQCYFSLLLMRLWREFTSLLSLSYSIPCLGVRLGERWLVEGVWWGYLVGEWGFIALRVALKNSNQQSIPQPGPVA